MRTNIITNWHHIQLCRNTNPFRLETLMGQVTLEGPGVSHNERTHAFWMITHGNYTHYMSHNTAFAKHFLAHNTSCAWWQQSVHKTICTTTKRQQSVQQSFSLEEISKFDFTERRLRLVSTCCEPIVRTHHSTITSHNHSSHPLSGGALKRVSAITEFEPLAIWKWCVYMWDPIRTYICEQDASATLYLMFSVFVHYLYHRNKSDSRRYAKKSSNLKRCLDAR